MKTLNQFLIAALLLGFGLMPGANHARADLEVSASVQIHARADFVAPLTPCGTWVEVGSYGRCFRPAGVAVEWRPYCEGHWIWTDCGWYWESDEPWGWACYHYGTWVVDPGFGWCWVPEIEWAPAWVEWRTGGGYIGWAPRAPRGVIVAAPLFAFVEVGHFHDPIRRSVVTVNNTTIIKQTTQITAIKRDTRTIDGRSQKVVVNEGPGVREIEKVTGKKMAPVSVQDAVRHAPAPRPVAPIERRPDPAQPEHPVNPGRDKTPGRDDSPVVPRHDTPLPPDHGVSVPDRHGPSEAPPDKSGGREKDSGGDHGGDRGRGRGGF